MLCKYTMPYQLCDKRHVLCISQIYQYSYDLQSSCVFSKLSRSSKKKKASTLTVSEKW